MRYAIVLVLIVGAHAGASPLWATGIEPIPAVQEQIVRVAAVQSEAELTSIIDELKAMSAPDYSDLIPQLVYAIVNAKSSRDALVPSLIMRRLGISTGQLRVALQPYRSAAEPRLQTEIENLLRDLAP